MAKIFMSKFEKNLKQLKNHIDRKVHINNLNSEILDRIVRRSVIEAKNTRDIILILNILAVEEALVDKYYSMLLTSPYFMYPDENILLWETNKNDILAEIKFVALQKRISIAHSDIFPNVSLYQNANEFIENLSYTRKFTELEIKVLLWVLFCDTQTSAENVVKVWNIIQDSDKFLNNLDNMSKYETKAFDSLCLLYSNHINIEGQKEFEGLYYNEQMNIAFLLFESIAHFPDVEHTNIFLKDIKNKYDEIFAIKPLRTNIWFLADDNLYKSSKLFESLNQLSFSTDDDAYYNSKEVKQFLNTCKLGKIPYVKKVFPKVTDTNVSRIGGYPEFILNSVSKKSIEWPHYYINDEYHPLKFLAQLVMADKRIVNIFYDLEEDIAESFEPTGQANAAYVNGENIPDWITLLPINITDNLLWSVIMYPWEFDSNNLQNPRWIQEDETPKGMKYLTQIDSAGYDILAENNIIFGDLGSLYIFTDEYNNFRVLEQE